MADAEYCFVRIALAIGEADKKYKMKGFFTNFPLQKNLWMLRTMLRCCIFGCLIFLLTTCKVVEYKNVYHVIPVEEFNKKPKRVILMIGDGMGLTHITASMYSNNNKTVLEAFPIVGLQKCDSADALATDSAAAATAMACGVKTFNQAIGVDVDTIPQTSILIEAGQKGYATGVVTTSSLVHATPAAFYAHTSQRYQYENIAVDFLKANIDFAVGGGKKYFDRRDTDERDLYLDMENQGVYVSSFLEEIFQSAVPKANQPFVYFTADSEPLPASQGRDYLPMACRSAAKFLSKKSDSGFFLLVEGAQIDWTGHARNGEELLFEMKDFEKAIATVLELFQDDPPTLFPVKTCFSNFPAMPILLRWYLFLRSALDPLISLESMTIRQFIKSSGCS